MGAGGGSLGIPMPGILGIPRSGCWWGITWDLDAWDPPKVGAGGGLLGVLMLGILGIPWDLQKWVLGGESLGILLLGILGIPWDPQKCVLVGDHLGSRCLGYLESPKVGAGGGLLGIPMLEGLRDPLGPPKIASWWGLPRILIPGMPRDPKKVDCGGGSPGIPKNAGAGGGSPGTPMPGRLGEPLGPQKIWSWWGIS